MRAVRLVSPLHRLEEVGLHLHPFEYYRSVRIDNNSYFRALGFVLATQFHRHRHLIQRLELNFTVVEAYAKRLNETNFNALKQTFLVMLQHLSLNKPGLFDYQLARFLSSSKYADALVVLIARNFLLLKLKPKLSLQQCDSLLDFLAEPCKTVLQLSHQHLEFHFFTGKLDKCKHAKCTYLYSDALQLYILYRLDEIVSLTRDLQQQQLEYEELRFGKSKRKKKGYNEINLCIGCGNVIIKEGKPACDECMAVQHPDQGFGNQMKAARQNRKNMQLQSDHSMMKHALVRKKPKSPKCLKQSNLLNQVVRPTEKYLRLLQKQMVLKECFRVEDSPQAKQAKNQQQCHNEMSQLKRGIRRLPQLKLSNLNSISSLQSQRVYEPAISRVQDLQGQNKSDRKLPKIVRSSKNQLQKYKKAMKKQKLKPLS